MSKKPDPSRVSLNTLAVGCAVRLKRAQTASVVSVARLPPPASNAPKIRR